MGRGPVYSVNIDFYFSDAVAGSRAWYGQGAMPEKASDGAAAAEIASGAGDEKVSAITPKGLDVSAVLDPKAPARTFDWSCWRFRKCLRFH